MTASLYNQTLDILHQSFKTLDIKLAKARVSNRA